MEAIYYEYNVHDRSVRLERLQKACSVILENAMTRKTVRAIGIIIDVTDDEMSQNVNATKVEHVNSEEINHFGFSNEHAQKCHRRLKLAGSDILALHEWCKHFCHHLTHQSSTKEVLTSSHSEGKQHTHIKKPAHNTQEKTDKTFTCSHVYPPRFFLIARIAPHSVNHLMMYMNWQTSIHAHKNSPLCAAHIIMLSLHHLSLLLSFDDNVTKQREEHRSEEELLFCKQTNSKWGDLSQLLLHHQYLLFDTTWMISKEVEQEIELKEMASSHSMGKRKMIGKQYKGNVAQTCNVSKDQLIDLFFNQVYRKLHFPKHQCALWLSYNTFLSDCSNEYSSSIDTYNNDVHDNYATSNNNVAHCYFTEYMKRFRLLFTHLHKANTLSRTPQQRSENSFMWRLCCGYGGTVDDLCHDAMHLVLESLPPLSTKTMQHKSEMKQFSATQASIISSLPIHNTSKTFHLRALRDVYALVSVISGRDGADLYNDACTVCKHIYHRLCVAASLRKFKSELVPFECKMIRQVTKESAEKPKVRIEELEGVSVADTTKCKRKRKRKRDAESSQEKTNSKRAHITLNNTPSSTEITTSTENKDGKLQTKSSMSDVPNKLIPL